MWRVCWRRPRSPRTCNLFNSFQRKGKPDHVGAPDREVNCSVRWMNGFAEKDNALPVREQDRSASMARRPKISQMMSCGRLRRPISCAIICRSGGGGNDSVEVRLKARRSEAPSRASSSSRSTRAQVSTSTTIMPHWALAVDEILREVIAHVIHIHPPTAVSLACCAKSFEEPALSALWKTQRELPTLIQTLPPDSWDLIPAGRRSMGTIVRDSPQLCDRFTGPRTPS